MLKEKNKLSRRRFLRASAMTAVGLAAASCAQPTPQVIEKEVPVEKIVKETVVIQKEVPVEKVVKETVVVEKQVAIEKVVTATPLPSKYREAPLLAEMVKAGKLPPVDERLPANPRVLDVVDQIGKYGGSWNMLLADPSDTKLACVFGNSRLVTWDHTLTKLHPDLCEKFEVDKGGREFVFYLRKGLRWSDGAPLTSDDFRFCWEDAVNNKELFPQGLPTELTLAGSPATMSFPDAYTVRYSWGQPNKTFMPQTVASWSVNLYKPKHFMKQFHANYADKATIAKMVQEEGFKDWVALFKSRDREYEQDWPGRPTMQPWVPTGRPPQQKLIFTRNPYFHKVDPQGNQLPYLDELVMLTTDGALVAMKCTTGDADVQHRYLGFKDVTLLRENAAKGGYEVRLWKSDRAAQLSLLPNFCVKDEGLRGLFMDRRFRIAMSLGINRQEINDVLYLGMGVPMQQELLPWAPGYNKEWAEAYAQYDPKEANRLLDEMGLTKRDADGYRLRPDGQTLDLIFEAAGPVDEIELITSTYKGIGIKVIYRVTDRATYRARMVAGEAHVGCWGSEIGLDYSNGRNIVPLVSGTNMGMECWGAWHATKGQSGTEPPAPMKRMQELAKQWLVTYDEDESNKIRDEMRAIHAQEIYQLGTIGGLPMPVVVKKTMHNIPQDGICVFTRGGYLGWAEPCQWWKEV